MHPMDPKETKISKRLRRQVVISKTLSNDCINGVNWISSCLYCRQSTFKTEWEQWSFPCSHKIRQVAQKSKEN